MAAARSTDNGRSWQRFGSGDLRSWEKPVWRLASMSDPVGGVYACTESGLYLVAPTSR